MTLSKPRRPEKDGGQALCPRNLHSKRKVFIQASKQGKSTRRHDFREPWVPVVRLSTRITIFTWDPENLGRLPETVHQWLAQRRSYGKGLCSELAVGSQVSCHLGGTRSSLNKRGKARGGSGRNQSEVGGCGPRETGAR